MSETTPSREDKIRERAFDLWQQAGCPEDRADEFWQRAKEIELENPAPVPPEGDAGNFA